MNIDDIKIKLSQFAKSQLPFLVKLYDLILEKIPKKESLSDEGTSEYDIEEIQEENSDEELQEDNSEEIEIEEKTLSEEEQEQIKKEKRSKIIRIIAIVGILYFAIDEFVLSDNKNTEDFEEGQTTEQVKKQGLDDIDKLSEKGTQEVEAQMNKKKQDQMQKEKRNEQDFSTQDLAGDTPNNSKDEELLDLEDQINKESFQEVSSEDGLETIEFDNSGYEPIDISDQKKSDEEILFKEEDYEDITPVELTQEIEDTQTQEQIESSPQDEEIDGVSINILRELEEKLKQKELSRDQEILGKKQDLSLQGRKVPIVDYYTQGRGLVYNCQARHWACVNELNYLQCREGFQINNLRNADSTCLPFNVYKTLKDCKRAQYQAMDSDEEQNCR